MHLATGGEELQSGEALDLDILELVGSGVRHGNNDVLVILSNLIEHVRCVSIIYLVFLAELLPDWGEGFAVTAPWGIELNEDVLGWVEDDIVEVLANDNLDGVVGVVWDLLGFQVTLDGAIQNTVDEGGDTGGCKEK